MSKQLRSKKLDANQTGLKSGSWWFWNQLPSVFCADTPNFVNLNLRQKIYNFDSGIPSPSLAPQNVQIYNEREKIR